MDHPAHPLAPRDIPDLPAALRTLLAQVPRGRVTTYGMLAAALGNPVAARWVGHWLANHAHDADCPCHRVVRAGGVLGGGAAQARRLAAEGVVLRTLSVDLEACGFCDFTGDRPLARLQQAQHEVVAQAVISARRKIPDLVGGVDVSYPREDEAVAAYALIEVASGQRVWSHTVRRAVHFPYITSYLSFRELPILLDLLAEVRQARRLAEVLLVDGSGMLHPRHAGIATHLGVVTSQPTIGVTKTLLCGTVDLADLPPRAPRPIVLEERPIGVAIRPTAGSRRPIFVSPGHRVNVPFAAAVVLQLLRGRRLPEPLYWADRLSRAEGRRS